MSVMDAKLELSDNQAVSGNTRTRSDGFVDLGAASLYIGAGTPLYLNIRVHTAFVGGGQSGGTLECRLSDGASTACTGTTLISKTMATSLLAARKWILRVPVPFEGYMRYLRCQYVGSRATTAYTAGAIDSWISGATPDSNVGITT